MIDAWSVLALKAKVFLLSLASVALVNCFAESPADDVARLVARLKAENDALRRENQMLRRELVARGGRHGESIPKTVVDAPESVQNTQPDTGWWLSNSSHVRHNRKCRNYQKVKGRPCGPNDGRPCKACGG